MSEMEKMVVCCALTGSLTQRSQNPALPHTPEELARDAVECYEAGATMVHVHARMPDGTPTSSPQVFLEIQKLIKEQCDLIICMSTGGAPGMTIEQRLGHIPVCKPEFGSLNSGSMNFALARGTTILKEIIFPNKFETLAHYGDTFWEAGTAPEFEVYDVGQINNILFVTEQGHFHPPLNYNIVLGVLGGAAPTMENLMHMKNQIEKIPNATWCVTGIGRHQWRLLNQAMLLGGHVRTGLEDNIYVQRGVLAESNAQMVKKVVRMAKELDREIADLDEAKEILKVPRKKYS
jgi:3-keto-5-aminohexanoate cleavage enzyme